MKNEKLSSRELILAKIKDNQPELMALPALPSFAIIDSNQKNIDSLAIKAQFAQVLATIGGQVIEIDGYDEIISYVKGTFADASRIVTTISGLSGQLFDDKWIDGNPHDLANVELSIVAAHFGVAENGSVWVTEDLLCQQRVLPFITQNLAIVIDKQNIVPTMHHAYERIAGSDYGFGTFIAGPSKTADIEQSLVLGAHGSRTMTVFLMG